MAKENQPIVVRPLAPADEPAWRRLWAGYLTFYHQALTPDVTDVTWRRLNAGSTSLAQVLNGRSGSSRRSTRTSQPAGASAAGLRR